MPALAGYRLFVAAHSSGFVNGVGVRKLAALLNKFGRCSETFRDPFLRPMYFGLNFTAHLHVARHPGRQPSQFFADLANNQIECRLRILNRNQFPKVHGISQLDLFCASFPDAAFGGGLTCPALLILQKLNIALYGND